MRLPLSQLLVFACAPLGATEEPALQLDKSITPFVERFCIDCHDAETEKGDRNLEPFLDQPNAENHHDTLREILDQLNLGEMPPKKKKSVAQPSSDERRRVVAALSDYLIEIDRQSGPDASVLRRLTRHEYNNTIHELLGVHPEASDATVSFPVETLRHGFPNIGDAQVLSDHQLGLYLHAAQRYVDRAVVFGSKKPGKQTWTFAPKDFVHERNTNNTVWYRILSKDEQYLDIGHGEPVDRYPSYPKQFAREGVHASGTYRIKVKACAVGRNNRYDRSLFSVDLDYPLKMGFWHVPDRSLLARGASEGRVFVEAVDLPDDEPDEFEVTAWMPKGSIPYIHWINGEGSSKPILTRTQQRYHPETWFPRGTDLDDLNAKGEDTSRYQRDGWTWISDVYEGPGCGCSK